MYAGEVQPDGNNTDYSEPLAMVPEQYFLPGEIVEAYLELGLVSSSRGLGRAQHESTNVLVKSLGNGGVSAVLRLQLKLLFPVEQSIAFKA